MTVFAQRLFNLVRRLLASNLVCDYQEHHGACENAYVARLGPLHLEINDCFVLDHCDAFVTIRPRTPWGTLHLGYVACLGEDEIRRPGLYFHWEEPLPASRPATPTRSPNDEFPF
jgi:hypothetical protein